MTYEQTRPWAGAIAHAVQMKTMPPWFADPRYGHFANDVSLTSSRLRRLRPGRRRERLKGRRTTRLRREMARGMEYFAAGSCGENAEVGSDSGARRCEYTYEIVPTHFAEDRWVQMSEFRPGSPAHVHHAVVYIRPPDSQWLRHAPVGEPFTASTLNDPLERREAHETTSDLLLVYAPGSSPDQWPDGMAKFVPAGSDLVFQMHYTTNGTSDQDQTSIGMVFAKTPPKQRVITLQLNNHALHHSSGGG